MITALVLAAVVAAFFIGYHYKAYLVELAAEAALEVTKNVVNVGGEAVDTIETEVKAVETDVAKVV